MKEKARQKQKELYIVVFFLFAINPVLFECHWYFSFTFLVMQVVTKLFLVFYTANCNHQIIFSPFFITLLIILIYMFICVYPNNISCYYLSLAIKTTLSYKMLPPYWEGCMDFGIMIYM